MSRVDEPGWFDFLGIAFFLFLVIWGIDHPPEGRKPEGRPIDHGPAYKLNADFRRLMLLSQSARDSAGRARAINEALELYESIKCTPLRDSIKEDVKSWLMKIGAQEIEP